MAYLPSMLVELAVYGLISGLLMKIIRTGRYYADLYISLSISMLMGRIIAGIVQALIFSAGSYSLSAWAASYLIGTLPAIAIQLILIPAIVAALRKAKLLPLR